MLPSNSIFVSYRRSDSNDVTGRIYDRLSEHFGREIVFKDVDSIPFGVDFPTHLNRSVGNCQVLVAVIGLTWLEVLNERLSHPTDWVRAEIETALGRNIPVIPLLVGGAQMPKADELPDMLKELAYRNAAQARPDPDFHPDMTRLIRRLEEIVRSPEPLANPKNAPDNGLHLLSPDQLQRQELEKEYAKLRTKYELLTEQIEGELNEDNKDTLRTRRETIGRKMNNAWQTLQNKQV